MIRGTFISSVRRYEISNVIRGSLLGVLDDMRYDSETVSIANRALTYYDVDMRIYAIRGRAW